jgi:DNA-binding beta-propeller fold protein YncE
MRDMHRRKLVVIVAAAAAFVVVVIACAIDESITAPGENQPPTDLRAIFKGTHVELTWAPSWPNKETAYEIFRSLGDNLDYDMIKKLNEDEAGDPCTYEDKEILSGNRYFYKVRTLYDGNAGKFSNEKSVYTNMFYLWSVGKFSCKVYKINPVSGSVVASFEKPFLGVVSDPEPSGLTWDESNLWLAEMTSNRLYNATATGSIRLYFNAPNDSPWGLAWDGMYLWNADRDQRKIYRLDADDWGKVLGSFASPGNNPCGLTWADNYLWNADFGERKIFKIDPQSGSVVTSFSAPGEAPSGLAWDGAYLWNADKNSRTIYRIATDKGKVVASFPSPDMGPQGLAVQRRF